MDLINDLWEVDAQADWIPEDIQNHDEGRARLRRYLQKVLALLKRSLPNVTHCYIAVAGIESGDYTPIASLGRDLDSVAPTSTSGQGTLAATFLDNGNQVTLIADPARQPGYRGDPSVRQKLILQLHSHEELVGFVSLDSYSETAFSGDDIHELRRALPLLSRTVADGVFLTRLRQLTAPFESKENTIDLRDLYQEIVTRTAHGFGADASILRIYDPAHQLLIPEAIHGDVPSALLVPRAPGEGVCGKVFIADEPSWALAMPDREGTPTITGVPLDKTDEEYLSVNGAKSSIVMRLTSQGQHIGTLSFFHVRARRYSWRDIAIFKSFCQSVADTIRLYNTNTELRDTIAKLRFQSGQLTSVEMVALLGHDLSHKIFEASTNVDQYIKAVDKALAKSAKPATLDALAANALKTLQSVGETLRQIRSFYQEEFENADAEVQFSVEGIVKEIEQTVAGALSRNKVAIRANLTGKLVLVGRRTVLLQALYNLVLNSVEAIKSSKKGSTIFIHGQEERQGDVRKIIVTFWDDGPGINQRLFPNPQDVFLIGRTSKDRGTGTGLPVTRSLLSQYFQADLSLEDPRKALFKITIPLQGAS